MLDDRSLAAVDLIRSVAPRPASLTGMRDLADLSAQLGRPLRVGIARVDGIGDWILTVPLIQAIRAHASVASVTLFAPPKHHSLFGHSGLAVRPLDVWAAHHTPWPHGAIGKILALSAIGQRRARAAGRAYRGDVDLMVLPRWDTDRGQNLRFFAAGVGAPIAGHDPSAVDQASPKERRDVRCLSLACRDLREHAHESDRLSALGATLGTEPSFSPDAARTFFGLDASRSAPEQTTLVIHTGAHDGFRRWPAMHWQQLVEQVLTESAATITLVGDSSDRDLHDQLIARDPARLRSHAGSLPLAGLPGALDEGSVFVGSDSGPAHLAAVIGVPTFVISCFPEGDDPGHPNSPDRFAARSSAGGGVLRPPAQPRAFATLAGDERDAMIGLVTPAAVGQAVLGALREGAAA